MVSTATSRLNRGSPAYMAPEAFGANGLRATINDLQKMDIWSFAMVMFHILNPNVRYPYASELANMDAGLDGFEMMRRIYRMEKLPTCDTKYIHLQQSVWLPLMNLYSECAIFDVTSRPSTSDIVRRLTNAYVHVQP